MRVVNTLYVSDHDARIGARHQSLEIRRGRSLVGRYPLAALDSVVMTGRANITSEAIGRCVHSGIRVASLHRSGRIRYVIGGATRGNVLLRLAQARAHDDLDESIQLAQGFVAGKLQNQRRVLRRWAWDTTDTVGRRFLEEQRAIIEERLVGLELATTGDQVRGFEGDATRRYFKGLGAHLARTSEFAFTQRNRRPPRDPANALLSYLYGVLTVELIGALESVGLDPQIGYLHRLRPGRPSLALDVLEEFRPIVDRFAVAVLSRRQLVYRHFRTLPGGACELTEEGNRTLTEIYETWRSQETSHPLLRQTIPRALLPTVQATLLARTLRGDLASYPPYVIDR